MMKQQQWNSVMLLSDLDGTLLRQDKTISAEDLLAIQRLRQAGGKVALATGRTIQSARPYWTQLQIDCPIILYNGAAIYDPVSQKLCYTVTLPETFAALVQTVLEHFPEIGAEVLRADGTYVLRNNKEEAEHVALCRVTPVVCTVEEMPKQQWLKVLFAMDPKWMQPLQAFLREHPLPGTAFVQSSDYFYEMLPQGATKGSALERYRKLFSMQDTAIVAVGDYDNDIEMLQAADYSAAPANAQPSVQNVVDWNLSQSCEEGAIAACINFMFQSGIFPLE